LPKLDNSEHVKKTPSPKWVLSGFQRGNWAMQVDLILKSNATVKW
jgi:hypothetical protein